MSASRSSAGASALGVAVQLQLDVECVQRQVTGMVSALRQLRDRQARFRVGAAGERHVVQVLGDLLATGWEVLPDRRWPGTRRANLDVLLVGPGGVFVIDVKRWRDVRIVDGALWHGDAIATESIEALADQAEAVREALAGIGLAAAEVVPLLVLDGADVGSVRIGTGYVLGERQLAGFLLRRAARLTPEQVATLSAALEQACPPTPVPATVPTRASQGDRDRGQPELFDTDEVLRILVEAAAAEPIEAWMTWLHPNQIPLATKSWSGPARIRGAAGTGKTVVALHRARRLAGSGRRVLFSSYVTTLGPVFRSLFARLAPELIDQVTFASVHQVAVRLLRSAGVDVTVDQAALDDCFARAWSSVRRGSSLADVGVTPDYWRDEIAHVIKGLGVTDATTYAGLRRVGRRTRLHAGQRAAVWHLFTEYERRRVERALTDWDDVLLQALDLVASGTVASPWDSIIVDEVQDLTGTALRLLHALAGDAPDGLLLVGDGQQSIYPGGFTLAEVGVPVAGRAALLDVNYRNGSEILQRALALVGADTFDDLEPIGSDGARGVTAARSGGRVLVWAEADDATSQRYALLSHLQELHEQGVRYGDVAVLVPTNSAARHWRDVLRTAHVPVMLLADYDGTRQEAVKVGTFERSKALEFAHVLIPDSDAAPGQRRPHESGEAYAERAERERRRLYVAHTRARDGLWLGASPSADH